MPPAQIDLKGLFTPVVKADAVCVPVLLERNVRLELCATPAMWQSIFVAISEVHPEVAVLRPASRRRLGVRGPTGPKANNQALYQKILREHAAAPHRSRSAICREHKVPPSRLTGWLAMQMHHVKNPVPEVIALKARLAAERAPVRKPGGKLL